MRTEATRPDEPASQIRPIAKANDWALEDGYRITPATTGELRERAWSIVRSAYEARGYGSGERDPSRDDLTLELLVTHDTLGDAGTMSVDIDSSAGLPCDATFREQVDPLRQAGLRLVEFTRLAIAAGHASAAIVPSALLSFGRIYARRLRGCTDLLIETSPRLVGYYQRVWGFTPLSGPRPCSRVNGAPAILIRCDLTEENAAITRRRAEFASPAWPALSLSAADDAIADYLRLALPSSPTHYRSRYGHI